MKEMFYYFNTYSHQLVGGVYNGLLQYIDQYLFGGVRFKKKIISTYNKAIQTIKENPDYTAYYPVLCIDPSFAIGPSEAENALLQKFPVSGGITAFTHDPIISSDDAIISPGYTRIVTSVSAIMWFDSVMEHIDSQMRMIQAFYGINKMSRPFSVTSFNPVPYKLVDDSGNNHNIDWGNVASISIFDVTGQQYYMLPVFSQPYITLTNIGDGSEKYGGNDISEIRVIFDFTVEVDILTFFVIRTDYKIEKLLCTLIPDSLDIVKVNSENVQYTESFPNSVFKDDKPHSQLEITNIKTADESDPENNTTNFGETVFVALYKDKPVDVSNYVNQGFRSVYVLRNGVKLSDQDYDVQNDTYTLKTYDTAYLMLYKV